MASKDSTPLVIWHAIFVLLAVGLGIGWYFTLNHTSDLEAQLKQSTEYESGAKKSIQDLQAELQSLKEVIGAAGTTPTPQVVSAAQTLLAMHAGDGSASARPLDAGMLKAGVDRGASEMTAVDRQIQLDAKVEELKELRASQDEAKKSLTEALSLKDKELNDKERLHAEQIAQRRKQLDEVSAQLVIVQTQLSNARDTVEAEKRTLNDEIETQRSSLKGLRKEKMIVEDLKFEKPSGELVFVDTGAGLCTVDIGIRDDVRVGATFSVYAKNNSGVGRRQSDKDIKGKIEVVELLEAHLAKARIVEESETDPMAPGDPFYSPLFWPGQKLQIALVGMLDFDGNPGTDRVEFNRIVKEAGAEIVVQINDDGKAIGKSGEEVPRSEVASRITSATRFLVIGDLGDDSTADTAQKEIYTRIRSVLADMEDAARNNGVYIVKLKSFLEYNGYSSKRLVYTPTRDFPGILVNGAKSLRVNGSLGRRSSSAAISGTYAERKSKPLVSTGHTSKLYTQPRGEE